jgi:hypothetical protein
LLLDASSFSTLSVKFLLGLKLAEPLLDFELVFRVGQRSALCYLLLNLLLFKAAN